MNIREFVVAIVSTFDSEGFDEAAKSEEKLGETAAKTEGQLEGLERELGETAKTADKAGKETADAGRKVDKAGDEAETSGRQFLGFDISIKGLTASLKTLGPALAAGALAAGVAATAQAIEFVGEKTAELDFIAKKAQKTGFGFDAIQRLTHVATLSGTEIEVLTKGVSNLNIQMDVIARGGAGPAAEALADLGLKYDDLKEKDPTEQLRVIAGALETIEDPAQKSLQAFKLLGEEGKELIPFFNAGADAIDGMVASTGKIFTREQLAQAEAYQDQIAELTKVTEDLKGEAALALAPALGAVTDALREAIPVGLEVAGRVLDPMIVAVNRLFEAAGPLADLLGGKLVDSLGALIAPIEFGVQAFTLLVDQLSFVLEVGNQVIDWINMLLDAVENRWPEAFATAGAVVNALIHPLETARDVIADIFDWIERSVSKIGWLADQVRSIKASLGLGDDGSLGAGGAGAKLRETAAALLAQAQGGTGTGVTAASVGGAATSLLGRAQATARAALGSAKDVIERRAARKPARRGGGGGGKGKSAAAAEPPGILDTLDMRDPGSILAGRPAPQQLVITIAPTIKMIETMHIEVTSTTPAEPKVLREAAEQARDAVATRLEPLTKVVEDMFKLRAKALVASHGGGRQLPGST